MSASGSGTVRAVIVGGRVAALEAGLALADLAGERVSVTMVAPEPEFVYRPMAVASRLPMHRRSAIR